MIDVNVESAIIAFFMYGCSPGSFTSCLLQKKYDCAQKRAHPLLLAEDPDLKNHKKYVEHLLPNEIKGEKFLSWPGLVEKSKEEIRNLKMAYSIKCNSYVVNMIETYTKKCEFNK